MKIWPLIAGAASGLGKAVSLALAEHGADLLLAPIRIAGLHPGYGRALAAY